MSYRQHDANHDHAKVEALLRGPAGLLSGRELGPGNLSIVIERRHLPPLRAFRRGAQTGLSRIVSLEEEWSELLGTGIECCRSTDCEGAAREFHPGDLVSAITPRNRAISERKDTEKKGRAVGLSMLKEAVPSSPSRL